MNKTYINIELIKGTVPDKPLNTLYKVLHKNYPIQLKDPYMLRVHKKIATYRIYAFGDLWDPFLEKNLPEICGNKYCNSYIYYINRIERTESGSYIEIHYLHCVGNHYISYETI